MQQAKPNATPIQSMPITNSIPAQDATTFIPHHSYLDPAYLDASREGLQLQRPSWIGSQPRPHSSTPTVADMKHAARLTYSSAGLQAPVFVITSLSEPQWEPVEMQYTRREDGELAFFQDFEAEAGQHQYKLRLGLGDWWVLDESKPIVDDGAGNRNNVLDLLPPTPESITDTNAQGQLESATMAPSQKEDLETHMGDSATAPIQEPEQFTKNLDASTDVPESERVLFTHEAATTTHPDEALDEKTMEGEESWQDATQDDHVASPLFRHETAAAEHLEDALDVGASFDDQAEELKVQPDEEIDASPLFRHETMAPEAEEGAPLFRHESMHSPSEDGPVSPSLSQHSHHSHSSRHHARQQHHHDQDSAEIDENDPTLEPFPTDEAGIMKALARSSSRHSLDDEQMTTSPNAYSHQSHDGSRRSSKELNAIDETDEEPVAVDDASTNELVRERSGPKELPTPPMTPLEKDSATFEPFPAAPPRAKLAPANVQQEEDDVEVVKKSQAPSTLTAEQAGSFAQSVKQSLFGVAQWFAGLCGGRGRASGIVAVAVGVAAAAYKIRDMRENAA